MKSIVFPFFLMCSFVIFSGSVSIAQDAPNNVSNHRAGKRFIFKDDETLEDALSYVTATFSDEAADVGSCTIYILSIPGANLLFSNDTLTKMDRALASSLRGANQEGSCFEESLQLDKNEEAELFDTLGTRNADALVLKLAYYAVPDGIAAFAELRDASGAFLGVSGRHDLPVIKTTEPSMLADLTGGQKPRGIASRPSPEAGPALTSARLTVAQSQALEEVGLRAEIAEQKKNDRHATRQFNLRRVRRGADPAVKTLRVLDDSGFDGLGVELTDAFLRHASRKGQALVTTSGLEGGAQKGMIRLAANDAVKAPVDSIIVRMADADIAFRELFGNQADIAITRRPLNEKEAEAFGDAYGINMRNRNAEHVLGTAISGSDDVTECGITYAQQDFLVSTEDHPESERIYLYINPAIPSVVRDDLVDFALSNDGQKIISRRAADLDIQIGDTAYTYWRHEITGRQEPEVFEVLQSFRDTIETAQRFSATFRFDFASSDLVFDSRSEQDLDKLIEMIDKRHIDGRRIMLFGFADSMGQAAYNIKLSLSRAEAVATRLRLAGIRIPAANVYAIGEDAPIGCNLKQDGTPDEPGARRNRRVEVWMMS